MIPWEFQHRLMVVDLDKKVVRKQRIIRGKILKLNKTRTRAKELVSTDAPNLWKTFKDGVLKVCDKVYGKKNSRRHVVVE